MHFMQMKYGGPMRGDRARAHVIEELRKPANINDMRNALQFAADVLEGVSNRPHEDYCTDEECRCWKLPANRALLKVKAALEKDGE